MTAPRIPQVPSLRDRLLAASRGNRKNETTVLSPADEHRFKVWAAANEITDADSPDSFYDYRGAFKAGVGSQVSPVDNSPHWPDTFKQHGHPTFSQESQYSAGAGDGGTWQGEQFTAPTRADSVSMLRGLLAKMRKP